MEKKKGGNQMNSNYYDFLLAGNIKAEEIKKGIELKDYYNFCKIYNREKIEHSEKIISYNKQPITLCNKYTFINESECKNTLKRYKNCKTTEFPFAWLKDNMLKQNKTKRILKFTTDTEKFAGIKEIEDVKKYIKKLPPYSFALRTKIKLIAPYFSSDDDNLYLVDNPVLKDNVFKAPMIRGSGWKGTLAAAAKKLVSEDFSNFLPFARIWGLGSSEYRNLLASIEENLDKLKNNIISFSLFELGLKLSKDDIETINSKPQEFLKRLSLNLTTENIQNKTLTPYLQPHRGRAIFYPTFFNMLSLEVINPHDRKRRAGINPIFFEIVPEDAEGTLQISYSPHDAVLTETQVLKEQVNKDLAFLCKTIEEVADQGIGAKTKLGWGRFVLSDKKYCINGNDIAVEGWDLC